MADFKTHLTVSTAFGAAYGAGAYSLLGYPPAACILAGGLCSVSGMLPDIDSDSGRPLRESLAAGAALVPMMLVERFERWGMSAESIILAGAAIYVFVRFVLGEWVRSYTVHRGMFHSIPAAIVAGEIAFLLTSHASTERRWFMAGAVAIGYLSHLMLDEIYSVRFKYGIPRLKKSFGTALKIYSRQSFLSNLSVYSKLVLLSYLVIHDPGWMSRFPAKHLDGWAQQAVIDWRLAEQPKAPAVPASAEHDRLSAPAPAEPTNGQAADAFQPLWR